VTTAAKIPEPAGFHDAETLIRALREQDEGDDHAAWTARWATLLEEVTIEDAEAAIADVMQQLARIDDTLRIYRSKPSQAFNVPRRQMIRFREIRAAQLQYLRQWVYAQRRDERVQQQYELAQTKAAQRQRRLELHEAELARAETIDSVRAYKRAIYEREQQIARDRIAFIRSQVPDGSDPVMMVQAARHLILLLYHRLRDMGIDKPFDEHAQAIERALQGWLEGQALEVAVKSVDAELPA